MLKARAMISQMYHGISPSGGTEESSQRGRSECKVVHSPRRDDCAWWYPVQGEI